ncbi:helix-turn-helix domain-containing protein [Methylibium sp.]|uniref:helix-turn-helix domain-containing protein n=1 Tax=Methylibium sp. TaxID=2067992 RepID=UPI003D098D87
MVTKRLGPPKNASKVQCVEELHERINRVGDLRAQGMTIVQIAETLGCCTWRVCQAINIASAKSKVARKANSP